MTVNRTDRKSMKEDGEQKSRWSAETAEKCNERESERQPQVEVKEESKINRSNPSVVCQNGERKRGKGVSRKERRTWRRVK